MCMILDAHKWADFLNPTKKDMEPVHNWINNKNGKIVYSNHEKIEIEIKKSNGKAPDWLKERMRTKQVKFISKKNVMKAEEEIEKNKNLLKSNDIHILALAKASNTKLLCSSDFKLHQDFTNKNIIAGKVYQNKNHSHLLQSDACP